jgi:hypothetical protein
VRSMCGELPHMHLSNPPPPPRCWRSRQGGGGYRRLPTALTRLLTDALPGSVCGDAFVDILAPVASMPQWGQVGSLAFDSS